MGLTSWQVLAGLLVGIEVKRIDPWGMNRGHR